MYEVVDSNVTWAGTARGYGLGRCRDWQGDISGTKAVKKYYPDGCRRPRRGAPAAARLPAIKGGPLLKREGKSFVGTLPNKKTGI